MAEATRVRVLEAVEALGYRAEGPGRQLVTNHRKRHVRRPHKICLHMWFTKNTFHALLDNLIRKIESFHRVQDRFSIIFKTTLQNSAQARRRIAVAFASGPIPALASFGADDFREFLSIGLFAHLNDMLRTTRWLEVFEEDALNLCQHDGKYYALPGLTYAMPALGFLRDRVAAAGLNPDRGPRDWEELVHWVGRLSDPLAGRYGIAVATLYDWVHLFVDLVRQAGGEVVRETADGGWEPDLVSPPAIAAASFIKDLRWKYNAIGPAVLLPHDLWMRSLARGETAMLVGILHTREFSRSGLSLNDVGIVPLPRGPSRAICELSTIHWAVNARCTRSQVEGAVAFIDHLLSTELAEYRAGRMQWPWRDDPVIYTLKRDGSFYPQPLAHWPLHWMEALEQMREQARPFHLPLGYDLNVVGEMVLRLLCDPRADPAEEAERAQYPLIAAPPVSEGRYGSVGGASQVPSDGQMIYADSIL